MHRAAVHAAQISVAGRVALWVAVLAALGNNSPIALAPAGAAVLVALPFAAGWLTTQALPQSSFLHAVHSILLIALVVSFMVNTPTLPWWQQLGLKLAAAMALASVGRRLRGKGIRRAETALRICFFVALPLAVLASVIR